MESDEVEVLAELALVEVTRLTAETPPVAAFFGAIASRVAPAKAANPMVAICWPVNNTPADHETVRNGKLVLKGRAARAQKGKQLQVYMYVRLVQRCTFSRKNSGFELSFDQNTKILLKIFCLQGPLAMGTFNSKFYDVLYVEVYLMLSYTLLFSAQLLTGWSERCGSQ